MSASSFVSSIRVTGPSRRPESRAGHRSAPGRTPASPRLHSSRPPELAVRSSTPPEVSFYGLYTDSSEGVDRGGAGVLDSVEP